MLLGQELNYRPEILSAAMVQDPDLWVNGVLHHISGATLHKGRQLKRPGDLWIPRECYHFAWVL